MLSWFEKRLNAYPLSEPSEPPKGLLAFCLHYSHGAKKWLALMAVAAAAVAIGEIVVFGFIGDVVNWLAGADPETFLETDGWKLAGMAAMIVVILPTFMLVSTVTMHQTLLGNFPPAHPLDEPSLSHPPVDELFPGRVRRPHRRQADADGAGRARSGDEAARH